MWTKRKNYVTWVNSGYICAVTKEDAEGFNRYWGKNNKMLLSEKKFKEKKLAYPDTFRIKAEEEKEVYSGAKLLRLWVTKPGFYWSDSTESWYKPRKH